MKNQSKPEANKPIRKWNMDDVNEEAKVQTREMPKSLPSIPLCETRSRFIFII